MTDGASLLDQPVLVVNQKTKLIEVNTEYKVFDPSGEQVGLVRQVGQSKLKKFVRFVGDVDQFLTHHFEVIDGTGHVVLRLTRPAKVFKSRVVVSDGNDTEIGQIVQRNMIGRINFGLEVGGLEIGQINAENWRAWNFSIKDQAGIEVARVTKKWEGLAKTMFTTADNYVVEIKQQLVDPMRQMVVAAAVTIDVALKQDSRGLS